MATVRVSIVHVNGEIVSVVRPHTSNVVAVPAEGQSVTEADVDETVLPHLARTHRVDTTSVEVVEKG